MLRLENITKNYTTGKTSFPALKGISLAFRKNEFVSILGPSGCGKTTLLNIIGGLDKYTDGDLFIEGRSTKDYKSHDWDVYRNHRIGFIFQSYNLIPHQNILENVELALTISGYSKEEKRKKALKALSKVGLKKSWRKMPNQLSGGQCQRVAIARALVNEPDILLGDEPTGALDSKTSVQVMELIKKISKKKLVIMVTHNPPLAEQYSTRIISLLDGEVKKDTNPYKLSEEKKEVYKKHDSVKIGSKTSVKPDKAKMSFWSAFKLSAKNLISKKKRTVMVIAASSIGIVGVSAVLAVSTGVKGYISNTQKDMLSGNPLNVGETSVDLVSILRNLSTTLQRQAVSESIKDGYLDIEYLTGALISQAKEGVLIQNNLDDNYRKFVEYGKTLGEKQSGIVDTYIDYNFYVANNIYTEAGVYDKQTDDKWEVSNNYVYSMSGLKNIYTALLDTIEADGADFTPLANIAANFPSVIYQGLDNTEYLQEQYDLIDPKTMRWPNKLTEEEQSKSDKPFECVIVLNKRKKLVDLIVTLSGLLSEKDFMKCIFEFIKTEPDQKVIESISKIALDNVMKKTFYYIPNGREGQEGAFKSTLNSATGCYTNQLKPFDYNYRFETVKTGEGEEKVVTGFKSNQEGSTTQIDIANDDDSKTTAKKIKVVGIISPKEGRNYGSLSSGIYFQSDLANKMMNDSGFTESYSEETKSKNSEIYNTVIDKNRWITSYVTDPNKVLYSLNYGTYSNKVILDPEGIIEKDQSYGLYYEMNFGRVSKFEGDVPEVKTLKTYGTVGNSAGIVKHYKPNTEEVESIEISSTLNPRALSGRKLSYAKTETNENLSVLFKKLPYRISVYSRDFQTKDKAKAYLEQWNQKGDVRIGPNPTDIVKDTQRTKVTVPDNLTIVINMVNGLITTTTVSLTIFASLSLVVSSVMIGIITYISVMERIKEIGVIRSLGGRKKDVSHLFNAETFILGAASGLTGVIITYVFELVLDVVVYARFKIPMLADLKWWTAIIMIVLSIALTAISGLIPAKSAANKDPVNALRSE